MSDNSSVQLSSHGWMAHGAEWAQRPPLPPRPNRSIPGSDFRRPGGAHPGAATPAQEAGAGSPQAGGGVVEEACE